LGEIRVFSFVFAPRSWALCNGQLLPINQNQALFSLLGTNYGGNGQTNFALPDLRAKTPIHVGAGFGLAQTGGEQSHTLTLAELPTHQHGIEGTHSAAVANTAPTGNRFANATTQVYRQPQPGVGLVPAGLSNVGGSQAHQNMQPFLTISFCIALQGIFPSQN